MRPPRFDRRMAWMTCGLIAGLAIATFWPHEEVQAVATDREERFAISTVETGLGQPEAVFVLDFLTGRLTGATLNQQSAVFTNIYFRSIAADFQLDAAAKPRYVMIPGQTNLNNRGNTQVASGVLYIAELTSGKVVAYRFPFRISPKPLPPTTLEPFAFFPFREAVPAE